VAPSNAGAETPTGDFQSFPVIRNPDQAPPSIKAVEAAGQTRFQNPLFLIYIKSNDGGCL
jgi:hypothetical protein